MGTYTDLSNFYMPVAHESNYETALNLNWAALETMFGNRAINVKDPRFGAVGDDDDDTDALEAALDAIPYGADGSGGAAVVFPPGVYTIARPLVVTPGVSGLNNASISLIGAGANASVIKWKTGVAQPVAMIRMAQGTPGNNANNHGVWQGLMLDGNSIAKTAIWLTDICQMTFDHLRFIRCAYGPENNDSQLVMSIANTGPLLNTISNCSFDGSNKGLYVENGNANRVVYNEFYNTKDYSVYCDTGSNLILGNSFEGVGYDGDHSVRVLGGHTVVGNRFEDISSGEPNSRSVLVEANSSGTQIAHNLFGYQGPGGPQIELLSGCNEIDIMGNFYSNSPPDGQNIKLEPGIAAFANIRVFMEQNVGPNHFGAHPGVTAGFAGEQRWGFNRLAVGSAVQPGAALDVVGQAFTDGVSTKVKAGAPVDGDFTNVENGMIAVDSTNNRIYVRVGGVWKYATLT